jgi:hypothetical protein
VNERVESRHRKLIVRHYTKCWLTATILRPLAALQEAVYCERVLKRFAEINPDLSHLTTARFGPHAEDALKYIQCGTSMAEGS